MAETKDKRVRAATPKVAGGQQSFATPSPVSSQPAGNQASLRALAAESQIVSARARPSSSISYPPAPGAVVGIELYYVVGDAFFWGKGLYTPTDVYKSDHFLMNKHYWLVPQLKKATDEVVAYVAFDPDIRRNEWVIGPNELSFFFEHESLYLGIAAATYPMAGGDPRGYQVAHGRMISSAFRGNTEGVIEHFGWEWRSALTDPEWYFQALGSIATMPTAPKPSVSATPIPKRGATTSTPLPEAGVTTSTPVPQAGATTSSAVVNPVGSQGPTPQTGKPLVEPGAAPLPVLGLPVSKASVPPVSPEAASAPKTVPTSAQSAQPKEPLSSSASEAQMPDVPPKSGRSPSSVQKFLEQEGLTASEIIGFGSEDAQRLGPASAARVERLLEHFTSEDMKSLGAYLFDNEIVLDDAAVDALIRKVPKGKMGDALRDGRVAEAHGEMTRSPGWQEEGAALAKTTTEQAGKIPLSEFSETPGSAVLGEAMAANGRPQPAVGYHAHHIVPERQFGYGMEWARTRLELAGSGVNEAPNGAWLAGSKSTANPELTRLHNSYMHAGKQVEYAYTLTKRLADKTGQAFLDELEKIGMEMETGLFKTEEIPHGWKTKWEPGMNVPTEGSTHPGWIQE